MRGDFVAIAMQGDFGKPMPALVIQADQFGEHTTVTVLPVTSTIVAAHHHSAKRRKWFAETFTGHA